VTDPPQITTEGEYRRQVGRRIRLRRAALGLLQRQVAEKSGTAQSAVAQFERGELGLDTWRLLLIADALEVPPEWLLSRDGGPVTVSTDRDGRP
jgi:transcriptional regulator with XRE-family HTH domain